MHLFCFQSDAFSSPVNWCASSEHPHSYCTPSSHWTSRGFVRSGARLAGATSTGAPRSRRPSTAAPPGGLAAQAAGGQNRGRVYSTRPWRSFRCDASARRPGRLRSAVSAGTPRQSPVRPRQPAHTPRQPAGAPPDGAEDGVGGGRRRLPDRPLPPAGRGVRRRALPGGARRHTVTAQDATGTWHPGAFTLLNRAS